MYIQRQNVGTRQNAHTPNRRTRNQNQSLAQQFGLYFEIPIGQPAQTPTLTREQIQQSVETKIYDSSFNEIVCPITMESFVDGESILQIKKCRHIFKNDPLSRWLENHSTCPVCRQNILETPRQSVRANSGFRDDIQRILTGISSIPSSLEEVD